MTTLEMVSILGIGIFAIALWCLFMKRGMKDPNLYFIGMCLMEFDLMKRHALDDPISTLDKIFIWLFAIIIIGQGLERIHAFWNWIKNRG